MGQHNILNHISTLLSFLNMENHGHNFFVHMFLLSDNAQQSVTFQKFSGM